MVYTLLRRMVSYPKYCSRIKLYEKQHNIIIKDRKYSNSKKWWNLALNFTAATHIQVSKHSFHQRFYNWKSGGEKEVEETKKLKKSLTFNLNSFICFFKCSVTDKNLELDHMHQAVHLMQQLLHLADESAIN